MSFLCVYSFRGERERVGGFTLIIFLLFCDQMSLTRDAMDWPVIGTLSLPYLRIGLIFDSDLAEMFCQLNLHGQVNSDSDLVCFIY